MTADRIVAIAVSIAGAIALLITAIVPIVTTRMRRSQLGGDPVVIQGQPVEFLSNAARVTSGDKEIIELLRGQVADCKAERDREQVRERAREADNDRLERALEQVRDRLERANNDLRDLGKPGR